MNRFLLSFRVVSFVSFEKELGREVRLFADKSTYSRFFNFPNDSGMLVLFDHSENSHTVAVAHICLGLSMSGEL